MEAKGKRLPKRSDNSKRPFTPMPPKEQLLISSIFTWEAVIKPDSNKRIWLRRRVMKSYLLAFGKALFICAKIH
jgi:hypothetical protein